MLERLQDSGVRTLTPIQVISVARNTSIFLCIDSAVSLPGSDRDISAGCLSLVGRNSGRCSGKYRGSSHGRFKAGEEQDSTQEASRLHCDRV